MRWRLAVIGFLALAGCQLALPGAGTAVSPIGGGEIEVTTIDPPADPATESGATPALAETQAAEAPAETPPEETPAEAGPAPAPVVKSPVQIACERRKGTWASIGAGSGAFCQLPTRDGGKSCRKSTDCQGYCLARSGTCAPVMPMFGCQEILNEDGRMLTECIN